MRKFLPKALAILTQHDRYLVSAGVDFEWSSKLWVHNVFRVYELVFGRRFGIRAEVSSIQGEGGVHYQYAHSFESTCALLEQAIRNLGLYRVKIFIPVFNTPLGIPIPTNPYIFAIAFDAAKATYDVSGSYSHTCTGSNGFLVLYAYDLGGGFSGATYNSVALALLTSGFTGLGGGSKHYFYGLAGPSTGANTCATTGATGSATISYSGMSATQPDAASQYNPASTSSPVTTTHTTVLDNCWVLWGIVDDDVKTLNASTGVVFRSSILGTDNSLKIVYDSNSAKTPAGAYTVACTFASGTTAVSSLLMSVAPFVASPAKDITADLIFFN